MAGVNIDENHRGSMADGSLDQAELDSRWRAAEKILRHRFEHDGLLPAQRKVIERVLRGHNVLAVLPTGHGKSLCYQLASQVLPGLTVVVSPLVSLMKDQCDSLAHKSIKAVRIDQSVSPDEFRDAWRSVRSGEAKLLYLAPERFFNERFAAQIGDLPLSMLAIDEAHCMSQWGHHFRPDYLRLPELVERYRIGQTLALTATATPAVVKDIRGAFSIDSKNTIRLSTHRPNLRLHCTPTRTDQRDQILIDRLGGPPKKKTRRSGTASPSRSKRRNSTLVYVTRRNTADQLADTLRESGFAPLVYHAGLSAAERDDVQREFIESDNSVLIGTIAFGMGVDKANIRRVIHYNPSQSIEAYSQEIGRGGRDGKPCECETLLVAEDQTALRNLAASDLPSDAALSRLIERLIGQPDRFYLALGKLGWEVNLSTPAVATLLIRLQSLGYVRCLPMRYDTYRITPKYTNEKIVQESSPSHRDAVRAILASLAKGRRGFRVNLIVASEQHGIEREKLIEAIEQTAIEGLWNVESADSMHGYEWIKRIKRPKSLVKSLRQHAFDQFENNAQRVGQLMGFLECHRCLAIELAEHFGHRRSRICGRCTVCLCQGPFSNQIVPSDSIGRSALGVLETAIRQYPDLFAEPVDQAKFLCGLSTPFFRRFRLFKNPGYGVCEDVPFQRVLAALTK
ncbi:ATP-dependent DNA helicase RecQ [Rhodopirellula rubra]|uniref:DNA 3'-5' helicase n=1 Tax=Aporhodopirellula rubra TaxID=980271 RepID=A0A7W5H7M7_9BACT|nr:RecQ family ATP-dependent DNA helicase [Aporhodopirellula rubra]MBB3208584.1 ATP-dependent DNA helicase RecQ [Aporhodopirellula rubra]